MSERAWKILQRAVWAAVAVISLMGLGVELWHHLAPSPLADALLPKGSLSFEGNVPTWLASSLLLSCAIVAGSIAQDPAQLRQRSWIVVAMLFVWASLDEAAELHENLGGALDLGGVLYFDWILSALVLLIAVAIALWPWFRELPRSTKLRLIAAGAVYFGGAIAMELPLGWWTERAGPESLGYALIDWVEETLELCGVVLFLRTLLAHRAGAPGAAPRGDAEVAP